MGTFAGLARRAGRMLVALGALSSALAFADEVDVLAAAAAKAPLDEVAAAFERATGHRVRAEYTTAGGVESRIRAGARPDVVANTRERIDATVAAKLVAGPARDVGVVRVGIAARRGAAKPDLASVDGFRASLLAAGSIAYSDPASGGTVGTHFAKVVERLGIADALRPKTRLAKDGLAAMQMAARGEVDLAVTQVSEIVHVDADLLVGPLPDALQLATVYAVAPVREEPTPAAKAFLDALHSPAGAAAFAHAGFR